MLTYSAPSGRIIGQVTDNSNASVPNTKVSAENVNTGQQRGTTSTANGRYVLPDIPVGTYNVTVEQQGFQKVERPNIVVTVASPVLRTAISGV